MAWGKCHKKKATRGILLLMNPRQANVMLAYPIPEAETLLSTKLDAAKSGLENCEEDLDFLREQITVRRLFK